ncbi:tropomyosin-like [Scomber scombrus]|uniref:Tropomyosin-like n=1 Tax=Scomber scombrus TaxID=13677 RepID=A0AAV1Q2Q1_SCOSC
MKKKEIYDRMMEAGFAVEDLMNEIVAENKELIKRVKELQQKLTDVKKKREKGDEDEEAQREQLLLEEEQRELVKDQMIYRRKMEKEIQKLREQNEHLTAEVDQLSLGKKYKDHLENMRTVEQILQHELEKIQRILCSKDDEIKKDKKDKEHQDGKTGSWWRRGAAGLWKGLKISGLTILGVSMTLGVIAWMAPVCNHPDPDCNFWNMAFDLLDPYDKFKAKQPPVY